MLPVCIGCPKNTMFLRPIELFHLSKKETHIWIQHNKTNNFWDFCMGRRKPFFGLSLFYVRRNGEKMLLLAENNSRRNDWQQCTDRNLVRFWHLWWQYCTQSIYTFFESPQPGRHFESLSECLTSCVYAWVTIKCWIFKIESPQLYTILVAKKLFRNFLTK